MFMKCLSTLGLFSFLWPFSFSSLISDIKHVAESNKQERRSIRQSYWPGCQQTSLQSIHEPRSGIYRRMTIPMWLPGRVESKCHTYISFISFCMVCWLLLRVYVSFCLHIIPCLQGIGRPSRSINIGIFLGVIVLCTRIVPRLLGNFASYNPIFVPYFIGAFGTPDLHLQSTSVCCIILCTFNSLFSLSLSFSHLLRSLFGYETTWYFFLLAQQTRNDTLHSKMVDVDGGGYPWYMNRCVFFL